LALTAKLETITLRKTNEKKVKHKEKFEWKKVAPKTATDTKDRNRKMYNWCTKHKMWTLHKSSESKLESPKRRRHQRGKDYKGLQLKQALSAIEEDEDSVK